MTRRDRPETRLLHVGTGQKPSLTTPAALVQKGSTVLLPDAAALYDETRVTYGRSGLTTHDALTEALAELEGARQVRLFPSGLAALAAGLTAVLRGGDEILVTEAVYKPTRRFCHRVLARFGVATRYYPARASAADIEAMIGPATRLIVLETPGSLTFEFQDVPAIAAMARRRGLLTLIDNTWAAGLYFRPLAHGVDLSVQALTKYVGGHSDVFMGSVASSDAALSQLVDQTVIDHGWAVSPEDAFMMLRGLRTLPTRLARHDQSGRRLAEWLAGQPAVAEVLHPALPSSPDHAIWRRDFTGAAGLFAFVLNPAAGVTAEAFLDRLTVFGLGFSWGGYESLALNCDPQFTVRESPPTFPGPLVRLSVGLEAPEDLIADLARGLQV